ncbi:glycosyltransferase family 2 protein [Paracoccus thiocyanatus]|uniref:glycosyltransferase family 2 protein n=1 Tax=Paracoccus thiocyanatus TaxID=34006 RepID=UPI0015F25E66|nr:glycosyltransferase family 2 protein [Paracoccus thiocyanatus]
MKRIVVTTVKDEAPYLVEWIAYQKLLGFDEIVITSNDSTDGTDEILERLEAGGWCKAIRFKRADYKTPPQITGFNLICELPELSEPALVFASDVDEFLQVNVGETGTLDDLLEAAPDFDMMLIRWRVFGSAALLTHEEDLTIRRFQFASPTSYHGQIFLHGQEESLGKPDYKRDLASTEFNRHQSQRWTRTYKTLFKYVPGDKISVHLPRINREGLAKIDGGGRRDPNERYSHLSFFGEHTYDGSYALCQLNHYANRSVDEYLMKMLKGDSIYAVNPRGLDHWKVAECNEVASTDVERWEKPLEALVAKIIAECDLRPLLDDAMVRRQAQLDEALAAVPELAALRELMAEMAGAAFSRSVAIA